MSWYFGVWRSLVSRMVRVHEAAGSNPATPTKIKGLPWQSFYFGLRSGFEEGGQHEVLVNNMPVACCLARGQNPLLPGRPPWGVDRKQFCSTRKPYHYTLTQNPWRNSKNNKFAHTKQGVGILYWKLYWLVTLPFSVYTAKIQPV